MKKVFIDFYGCSASIRLSPSGCAHLIVRDAWGKKIHDKMYVTLRGARIAMGRMSDGWREV